MDMKHVTQAMLLNQVIGSMGSLRDHLVPIYLNKLSPILCSI